MTYKIRPLAWRFEDGQWRADAGDFSYFIGLLEEGKWSLWTNAGMLVYTGSAEEGKQLAEADWRELILPALEEVPVEPVNQRMLAALKLIALQFAGQILCDSPDCSDCAFLRPVYEAIAEAERGRE